MVQFSVCKTAVCHSDHLELGKNKQTKKEQHFNTCSFMPPGLSDIQLVCIASLSAGTGKSHSNTKRVCVDECFWCVKRLDRLNTVFSQPGSDQGADFTSYFVLLAPDCELKLKPSSHTDILLVSNSRGPIRSDLLQSH